MKRVDFWDFFMLNFSYNNFFQRKECQMRRRILILGLLALSVCQLAAAQTATGLVVNEGEQDLYLFSPFDSGQAFFNLSWSDPGDDMGFLLLCDIGGPDAFVWGTSVPLEDRFATLDVGVLGGSDCLLGVGLFNGANGTYRVNLQISGPGDLKVNGQGVLRRLEESDLENAATAALAGRLGETFSSLRNTLQSSSPSGR